MQRNKIYINAFNHIPGIGPQKLIILSNYFTNFFDAWTASEKDLENAGLTKKPIKSIISHRKTINPELLWEKCSQEGINLIYSKEPEFPQNLKEINQPPFFLYYRGDIEALKNHSATIVGSRKISDYAKRATESLTTDLANSEIAIVSGLALGTDAIAHHNTLKNNGIAIAVLGGGIDDNTIAPKSNFCLAHQILEKDGVIISEYPPGTAPSRGTFPARNRIMAAFSDVIIIIEASAKSGTLVTAEHACALNRPLFALPGSFFSQNAVGPNTLIKEKKAEILLKSEQILRLFHKKQPTSIRTITFTDKNQEALYRIIKKHPEGIHVNQLIKTSPLDATTISSTLTMMEIDGIAKNTGNQIYIVK